MLGLVARLLLKLFYIFMPGMRSIPRTQETSIASNSTRIPAGVYGIAFELSTVLHHQWRYDTNWLQKLQTFDLLSYYNKRKLCESALQSLGYDPKRLPRAADPSQLDSSGEADAQAYDAQINALMDGGMPPLSGAPPSSSGQDFHFGDTSLPVCSTRRTGNQGEET